MSLVQFKDYLVCLAALTDCASSTLSMLQVNVEKLLLDGHSIPLNCLHVRLENVKSSTGYFLSSYKDLRNIDAQH